MSKPAFRNLFSFRSRRNRTSYLLFTGAVIPVILALRFLMEYIAVALDSGAELDSVGIPLVLAVAALTIAVVVSTCAVVSQRLRDCDFSGYWLLTMFIPYIGVIAPFALIFIPGARRQDADPLD